MKPRGAPTLAMWEAARKVGVTKDEGLRLFNYDPCIVCFDLLWIGAGPSPYEIPTESGWPEPATRLCEPCDLKLCEDHADDHAQDERHAESIYEIEEEV